MKTSSKTEAVQQHSTPDSIPDHTHSLVDLSSNVVVCYVRPDGDDSNDGLSDTPDGAFNSIRRAVEAMQEYRRTGNCTIYVADGTYNEAVYISGGEWIGRDTLYIEGNTTSPSSCVINSRAGVGIQIHNKINVIIKGIKVISAGHGFQAFDYSFMMIEHCDFGPCFNAHMSLGRHSRIRIIKDYTISGDAEEHVICDGLSIFSSSMATVTFEGTRTFSRAVFVCEYQSSSLQFASPLVTYTGNVKGTQYIVGANATLVTTAPDLSFLPGDAKGYTWGGGVAVSVTSRAELSAPDGWTSPSGIADRTGFDTETATTQDVAKTLKALIDDLMEKGIIRE